jgi:hypothetical protein
LAAPFRNDDNVTSEIVTGSDVCPASAPVTASALFVTSGKTTSSSGGGSGTLLQPAWL